MRKAKLCGFLAGKKEVHVILYITETPLTGEWKKSMKNAKKKIKIKNWVLFFCLLAFWLDFVCVCFLKPMIASKPTEQGS